MEAALREEYEEGGALHELAAIAPPVTLRQASIIVSSPICADCQGFIDIVNRELNLVVTVQDRFAQG